MSQSSREDFFDKMHEWSERKLQLLQKYVDPAAKILGSINRIYYVDGFAGRGTYRDGAIGSPIRMAELAQQFVSEGKSYSFRCINVEENDEYFANLQEETAKYGNIVRNIHGRFADNLDYILQVIGTQPAIFFLDPFGIKGIDWSAVRKIINRGAQTDLWIRFDHIDVRRLDGNYEINGRKFEILSSAFGIQDQEYLHSLLASGDTPEERIKGCMELYRDRLEQEFRKAKPAGYANAYAIKSLTGLDKYYLIFVTAHEKGIVLASNVVYGVEEKYHRELQEYRETQKLEGGLPEQLSMFPPVEPTKEEIFRGKVTHLRTDIWRHCKGQTLSRINIHARILDTWFGRVKASHMTGALKVLKDEGYILEMSGNISDDRTRFKFRVSD
jgi:three-Cys-motif partner protein